MLNSHNKIQEVYCIIILGGLTACVPSVNQSRHTHARTSPLVHTLLMISVTIDTVQRSQVGLVSRVIII